MGILKRAISRDASVVSMAIDATDIVNEIEKIHQTSAVVTAALGRLTIAASISSVSFAVQSNPCQGYRDEFLSWFHPGIFRDISFIDRLLL